MILGIIGEPSASDPSVPEFAILNDNQAGEVFISPQTRLPIVDVSASPGFCPIVDSASEIRDENGQKVDAAAALNDLKVDHLAQFVLRGVRDSFENGVQTQDNGLRVSLHLKDVEFVVCASRNGGEIELLDLRNRPAIRREIDDIRSPALRRRLQSLVK